MPKPPRLSALPLLLLPLCPLNASDAEDSSATTAPEKSAWRDASLGLFGDAYRAFAADPSSDARLGEALTLLLQQPKTAANIDRAVAQLEAVAADTASADAIAARYFLGRAEQTHRLSPAPEAARRHYALLLEQHPGHVYAERALVKLAVIDLYDSIPEADRRARFDSYHGRLKSISDTASRRDLALMLADAALRFGYQGSVALDCLLVADAAGILRRIELSSTWIRIGRLAAENGRPELARDYYEKFLAAFTRDNRRRMVAELLAALPAPSTPVSAAR